MHNLLPNSQQFSDFLLASAEQNELNLVELKAWTSNIITTMGNYIFDKVSEKDRKRNINSPFLYLCENLYSATPLGLPNHRMNNETTIGKIRYQLENEADDTKFNNLIKNSSVKIQKDFTKWNWPIIQEIIETFL